jgi:hypothetical protein
MGPYRVYKLGVYLYPFATRDRAVEYILGQCYNGTVFEDFEILDGSDFL